MDSVARGVRFWQLVRLGVAGRAWASLLGVLGGAVGRSSMACGRYECGRLWLRLVIQKVGVMQHSSFRGKPGRQELVGKVVVWGREAGGGMSVVWSDLLRRVPDVVDLALRWECGRSLGD